MAKGSISAVAYYRMSTDRQEASIPDQRTAVEKMARAKGYTIIREYKDEGISGDDTERRFGFRQMLEDAKTQADFDCVVCWDQDRFGRFDPLEAGYWIKPLRDNGAWLETVGQGRIDWSDFAGRIAYTVQQEGKHAFLRDMSRSVARGMLAKAKRGEWLGGTSPYGYRLNDAKRLEWASAEEVQVVRWIFDEFLNRDKSLAMLASELNARGIRPRRAARNGDGPALWRGPTIRYILTRPTYLGHTVWNRQHSGAYHGVKSGEIAASTKARHRLVRNDKTDWVIFENTHPAPVDQATFDRVQQKLIARREGCSTPHKGGGGFALTGLLKCADCGWPLHGTTASGGKGGEKYHRYVCGKYIAHGRQGCHSNAVKEAEVLDMVLQTLQEKFLEPAHLAALKAEIRRQEAAERAGQEQPSADLDRRIAALSRKLETGTERWLTAPPDLVADAGRKLEEWRRERESLQEKRSAIAKPAASAEALDAAAEEIAQGIKTLRQRAAKAKPADLRAVLREMLEKVVIDFRQEPSGKRTRSVPTGGTMYLRDSLVTCRPLTIARPANVTSYGASTRITRNMDHKSKSTRFGRSTRKTPPTGSIRRSSSSDHAMTRTPCSLR
jgi:site-specific DNA recombinase